MRDWNEDNHAYIANHPCLTGVLAVMEFMKKVRILQKEAGKDYTVIPIVMAEDISSAFESIDHVLIGEVLDCVYNLEGDFRLKDTIMSYLDRESWIIDRKTQEKAKLEKTYVDKTSPQGSTLSPALWRIYDGIFTHMYKKELVRLKEKTKCIIDVFHVAYADDHVTIVVIKVKRTECVQKTKSRIKIIAETCRGLLDAATKAAGCGINPSRNASYLRSTPMNKRESRRRGLSGWDTASKWLMTVKLCSPVRS